MIDKSYSKVLILFNDGAWTEYDSVDLVTTLDALQGEMIIAIKPNGVTRILKNRWGNVT